MKRHVMVMATMAAMSACTVDAQTDGMVLVKGGTFQMGSPASEAERDADETLHEVTMQDFLMSATEVSQQEYESVMGHNPSERKGNNLPVENVTWYDAVAKLAPESVILKGLDVTYASYDRTAIRSWLDGISQYQQTSAIHTMKTGAVSAGDYYSLNGTRHNSMQKGINIVDGKKIIAQ